MVELASVDGPDGIQQPGLSESDVTEREGERERGKERGREKIHV